MTDHYSDLREADYDRRRQEEAPAPSYADYMDTETVDGSVSLAQLQILAERQAVIQSRVEDLEKQLESEKKLLRDISEQEIPELMDTVGVTDFKTRSGLRISIDEKIRAAIPKKKLHEALRWLELNGHGSLIKRKVSVAFGKGEESEAERLKSTLIDGEYVFDDNANVHPSTLSAFVREKLAEGEEIPLDLLGVFRQRSTKVELPQ